jgi:cytochrome c oxidase subunit III
MATDLQHAIPALQTMQLELPAHKGPSARIPERSETGVWIGMCAITMCFAAVTSAMIVRQGAANDWQHFHLPRILLINTLMIFASSVSLHLANRRLAGAVAAPGAAPESQRPLYSSGIAWLYATLGLGCLFVFGQILGWRILAARGWYLATNPSSSFFYVFTAMHAVHLVGGIGGLCYMLRKLSLTNGTARTTGMRAVSLYWHFMAGLWLFLLILLLVRT